MLELSSSFWELAFIIGEWSSTRTVLVGSFELLEEMLGVGILGLGLLIEGFELGLLIGVLGLGAVCTKKKAGGVLLLIRDRSGGIPW